jgi:glyoxylase-like metal-dependent hydrolase (beta-lactamase superfamily II)
MAGSLRVDHAVSSGTFSLDGETFDVDNNIWVVGNDDECIVIDAPHSVDDILAVVGDRTVKAIVCTHAHDDHVRMAPALRAKTGAPILLHPDDRPLWELTHPDQVWDIDLEDGAQLQIADTALTVLHTPGHAPGAVCLHAPDLGCVFTGDTLFKGGPGATGRSFSDGPTLEGSIRAKLFALPDDTVVHTGHGDDTTLVAERALLAANAIRRRARRLAGEECVP